MISHSRTGIWQWLSSMVLAQDVSWSGSQETTRGCHYLKAWPWFWISKMAHSHGIGRSTQFLTMRPSVELTECPHDMAVGFPPASDPREQGRSGKVFYDRASKVTPSLPPCSLGHTSEPWHNAGENVARSWGPGGKHRSASKRQGYDVTPGSLAGSPGYGVPCLLVLLTTLSNIPLRTESCVSYSY